MSLLPDSLELKVAACRHGHPLAVMSNLPGPDAELRPDQLLNLAEALITAAKHTMAEKPGITISIKIIEPGRS